jgi:hypothetical protein
MSHLSRTDDFNLLIVDELVVAVHLNAIITGLRKNTAIKSVRPVDRLISRREFDQTNAAAYEDSVPRTDDVDPRV